VTRLEQFRRLGHTRGVEKGELRGGTGKRSLGRLSNHKGQIRRIEERKSRKNIYSSQKKKGGEMRCAIHSPHRERPLWVGGGRRTRFDSFEARKCGGEKKRKGEKTTQKENPGLRKKKKAYVRCKNGSGGFLEKRKIKKGC